MVAIAEMRVPSEVKRIEMIDVRAPKEVEMGEMRKILSCTLLAAMTQIFEICLKFKITHVCAIEYTSCWMYIFVLLSFFKHLLITG